MARFEDLASRWRSWGGLVVAIACGSSIAALNWFAIAQGYARGDDLTASANAAISAQRYALFAVLLLIIGLRLVDARRATGHPASA